MCLGWVCFWFRLRFSLNPGEGSGQVVLPFLVSETGQLAEKITRLGLVLSAETPNQTKTTGVVSTAVISAKYLNVSVGFNVRLSSTNVEMHVELMLTTVSYC